MKAKEKKLVALAAVVGQESEIVQAGLPDCHVVVLNERLQRAVRRLHRLAVLHPP